MSKSIFNTQLLDVTRQAILKNASASKRSFVDAASASGVGGDPAAAGGDPMAAAGGDPMAAAGGDPMAAAGGGAPPGDPRIDQMMQMIQQMQQQQAAGGGGGAAGGVEPIKPKIDVNVEIMQMKKMIAKLCDAMGVQIPAAEMVATPQDLTQMGMQSEQGGAAAPPSSAISPIAPMQPAMPTGGGGGGEKTSQKRGSAVPRIESMRDLGDRAGAMAAVLRAQLG